MILQDVLLTEIIIRTNGKSIERFTPKIGKNAFVGYMPSDLKEGLLLSTRTPLDHDHYSKLLNGTVQVIFRASTPLKADSVMRGISAVLSELNEKPLVHAQVRVLKILPRHEPLMYPQNDTGGFEASVNFDVTCAFE